MSSRNRSRQTSFQALIVFALCATLALFAYPVVFQPTILAHEGLREQSESGEMECVSYCSPTRLGTVLMEVKIRLADQPLNEGDLRSKVRQQGLEATVYADGFERRLFATVPVSNRSVVSHDTHCSNAKKNPRSRKTRNYKRRKHFTLEVRRAGITVAANTFSCLGSLSFTK